MAGWQIADRIDLPAKSELSSCELCGTKFRHGAVVMRPRARSRAPITITVGGDCLTTLLRHRFADRQEILRKREETRQQIAEHYSALAKLIDIGSWINWVYENAPHELLDVAIGLKYLGAVNSASELNRVVAFHDRTRKYASDALLPFAVELRGLGVIVPRVMTLDRARRFVRELSGRDLRRLFRKRGQEYLDQYDMSDVYRWNGAWSRLGDQNQRLVAALAQLTDWIRDPNWQNWIAENIKFLPMNAAYKAPRFVWNHAEGLALLVEDPEPPRSLVEVFLWGRNESKRFLFEQLQLVDSNYEPDIFQLEKKVFWDVPTWCEC